MATRLKEQFDVYVVDMDGHRVIQGKAVGETPKYYQVITGGMWAGLKHKSNCFPTKETARREYYSRKIDHWANLMKTPESKRPYSLKHYHHGLKNENCLERIKYFSKQLEKLSQ